MNLTERALPQRHQHGEQGVGVLLPPGNADQSYRVVPSLDHVVSMIACPVRLSSDFTSFCKVLELVSGR